MNIRPFKANILEIKRLRIHNMILKYILFISNGYIGYQKQRNYRVEYVVFFI
ncbi:hypothetical protein KO116_02203 [Halomonas sp. KO116]|nr:hypothetical protein KO116_02203 [Halomonas sp. KO116]